MKDEFSKIDEAIEKFESASRDELFSYLSGTDEVLMQLALLKLNDVLSKNEAEIIVNTLTEHSSETREYCAFLINRMMKSDKTREYFVGDIVLDKFSKAISDVNPKVCRKIIEALPYYQEMERLLPILIKNSLDFIDGLQEKNKNKNYQYNTLSFRLYWTIFAIAFSLNEKFLNEYENELVNLSETLLNFKEYTLREKSAVLAQKISSIKKIPQIEQHLQKYADDENFFVKEILN